MKLKVPANNYGIVELFDAVATAMGHADVSKLEYDCCKVNVAKNIQDGFYERYTAIGREQNLSDEDVRASITMLLVISGPKVDENLADNEVEVFDGFIC